MPQESPCQTGYCVPQVLRTAIAILAGVLRTANGHRQYGGVVSPTHAP